MPDSWMKSGIGFHLWCDLGVCVANIDPDFFPATMWSFEFTHGVELIGIFQDLKKIYLGFPHKIQQFINIFSIECSLHNSGVSLP